MEDFFTLSLLILMTAAFIAGFVDAIAGGGGLITVPALLLVGVTPLEALATNKLQGIFGSGSAVVSYASKGHVNIRKQLPVAFACFLGAAIGAFTSARLPAEYLRAALPIILIGIALYFVLKKKLDDTDRTHLIAPFALGFLVMPLVGFYDGIFGPGAGSFYMLAFVSLGGFGMLKATAHTKLLNFASNIGGFVVFAFIGVVLWKTGLMMGLSQFFGARLGATFAMRKGSKIIKPLLAVISILMAIKLLSDPANPLRIWLGM
jgi:uncharacterized membrane protein YfcA